MIPSSSTQNDSSSSATKKKLNAKSYANKFVGQVHKKVTDNENVAMQKGETTRDVYIKPQQKRREKVAKLHSINDTSCFRTNKFSLQHIHFFGIFNHHQGLRGK